MHGFVFSQGKFTSFDVPGATVTQPNDINALGQIVGLYVDAAGAFHGFLMAGATFTSIDFPGAVITTAWGINSAGQIVGDYYLTDVNLPSHGFLAQPGNKAKGLPALGAAPGVIPSGEIVGRHFIAD